MLPPRRRHLGAPGTPERDPYREIDFRRELFSFCAAIRTMRHFLYWLVANSPGEAIVRTALNLPIIEFHREIGNQTLHARLVAVARKFYAGGPRDRTWDYDYNIAELDRNSAPGILGLAELALQELDKIDANARANAWY